MTDKTYMFQYGTDNRMLEDTGLITRDEVVSLFNKNREDFAKRLVLEENPQMVVWCCCDHNQAYGKTLHEWYADDFKVVDGTLYKIAPYVV